ncbi:hypothetical protein NDU88_004047 [Pleurodeles waltl]|uniref:SAP domain-containing protein n=1 Tax=Pleurodeles waltl TaxID=8319 RepID=A0AAV7WUI2_PLEWA|nr:hypothetical protein NDU88_004047 [Pleurodeles waltl]
MGAVTTGATAPVARPQHRRLRLEPAPLLRPRSLLLGFRPPAQRRSPNGPGRGAGSQAGEFDLALLEKYTVKQLKGFCRDLGVPTQGASRKKEFQMALRAWVEAHSEEDAEEEEEPEDCSPEDLLLSVDDVTTAIVPCAKPDSSVSDRSLTTEERREEREFQLQMARLKIEAQQEERRAEREAKAAERALAEKKLLLAHELSLKELEIKVRQSEPSSDGISIHAGPVEEKKVCIPKNVVPSFEVGDDIDKWLAAYEVALRAIGTSEEHWGVAWWFYVPAVGRDTFPTLAPQYRYVYAPMKVTLLGKFGLTPERYRQRFRDSTKLSTQTWVDCYYFSNKVQDGWVRAEK